MNKKGIFGPVRLMALLVVLVFVWLVLLPDAITPGITSSISAVQGSANADMTEFLLRMLPWGFVGMLVIGFIWLSATS